MMGKQKIEVGDLIEVKKGIFKKRGKAIVEGTDKDWWAISDHIEAKGAIIDIKDIVLLKKQVIPKKIILDYMRYETRS